METVNFNKILPTLSAAEKVMRVDRRQRNNQQTPFKETFKEKHKKKKKLKGAEHSKISDNSALTDSAEHRRHADTDTSAKSIQAMWRRIIDIRV